MKQCMQVLTNSLLNLRVVPSGFRHSTSFLFFFPNFGRSFVLFIYIKDLLKTNWVLWYLILIFFIYLFDLLVYKIFVPNTEFQTWKSFLVCFVNIYTSVTKKVTVDKIHANKRTFSGKKSAYIVLFKSMQLSLHAHFKHKHSIRYSFSCFCF